MSADTKPCRHCGETILSIARVCRHCHSNQGWFSNQRDPRHLMLALPFVLLVVAIPVGALAWAHSRAAQTFTTKSSCRGQVSAEVLSYELRPSESRVHLYVLAQIRNDSAGDVSEPAIRIESFDASGNLKDTFVRTIYGANIEPGHPKVFRIDGDSLLDGAQLKKLRAYVESATCRSAW